MREHVLIPSSSGCGAHAANITTGYASPRLNPFFFRVRCSPAAVARLDADRRLNPFFFRVRCSPLRKHPQIQAELS